LQRAIGLLGLLWLTCLPAVDAPAQDLPVMHLKVVGGLGNVRLYLNAEKPFWTEEIPRLSKGRITADITPSDTLGLRSDDMMRLVRLGSVSFGTASVSQLAAEDAVAASIDLPGMAPDLPALRRAISAFRSTLADYYRERSGAKLVGVWVYPAQVLFCNRAIGGLADLTGLRVRVAGPAQADLMETLGAISVATPFNQIVDTLRRKAVDCAITGTLSGNEIKLYEVTTHLYPLPINWGPALFVANAAMWDGFPPAVRDFLQTQLERLENNVWDAADYETAQGIACNTDAPDCKLGTPGHMTLVPVRDEDRARLSDIVNRIVVPRWAERCGVACVDRWNATIGMAVGIEAAAP
jgi:TRAP-type C4-dicarboxylate transport system substrate-binding protein